jgi:hypothetical protein
VRSASAPGRESSGNGRRQEAQRRGSTVNRASVRHRKRFLALSVRKTRFGLRKHPLGVGQFPVRAASSYNRATSQAGVLSRPLGASTTQAMRWHIEPWGARINWREGGAGAALSIRRQSC